MARKSRDPLERFTEKVGPADASGCTPWVGSRNNRGYGTFGCGGGQSTVAHRWAYEHFVGPIPAGLTLDHLCRNRACVNPAHLEAVPHSENVRRAENVGKSNLRKTHCPAGHPYDDENTYYAPSRPNRQCRICRRQSKNRAKDLAR